MNSDSKYDNKYSGYDGQNYRRNNSMNNSSFNDSTFDPRMLFTLLQRHIWTILVCVLISFSATYYLLNYYLLPIYESGGTLIITTDESSLPGSDDSGQDGSGVAEIISRSFTSKYGDPVQNAIYLFDAYELSEEVASQLKAKIDSNNVDRYPTFWSDYPEDSTMISISQAANRIRRGLTIEPVEPKSELVNVQNPNLLSVTFESYSPHEASDVVNLAIEAFQKISLEQKKNAASNALSFLQKKKEDARNQLNDAEDRLVSFKNENQLVAIDVQATNSVNSLSQLQAEKQNYEIQLESINSSIANYEKQLEAIRPGLKDQFSKAVGPTISKYQERLAELRTRRFVILSNNPRLKENPDSEPELRRLNQQISELEEEIQSLSDGMMKNDQGYRTMGDENLAEELSNIQQNLVELRIEKSQYESQTKVLNERIKEAESFLSNYPDKQVKLAKLESEVERQKQLLNNIISQESQIALWQQTQSSSGTIVDRANPKFIPVKPNKIRWLLFSVIIGFMLPAGILILKKSLSTLIKSAEQLEKYSYPLLSTVYDHQSLLNTRGWLNKNKANGNSNISDSLVFYHDAETPISEAYRKIVSQLLYSNPDSVLNSILITSSGQGEGKTTLAGNLAAAFAEVDKKVLIIDCDFRRPAIHKLFSLNNMIGIKQVLFEGAKLSEAIKNSGIQDVSVLTTGGGTISPAKILASDKFKEMIKVIRPNYDIILFDTPPQGLVSEVASLLSLTDQVIVTAKFGQSKENILKQTLKDLDKTEKTEIGIVLTGYKPEKSYDSYETKDLHKYRYKEYYEYEKFGKK